MTNELLKLIKKSDDLEIFLTLLRRVLDDAADARIVMTGVENDSLDVRKGVVQVIQQLLIEPLTLQKQFKTPTEPVDYT